MMMGVAVPQLYYYDFTSKNQKISGSSLAHINPKTKNMMSLRAVRRFSAGLKQIKNRVVSLKPSILR